MESHGVYISSMTLALELQTSRVSLLLEICLDVRGLPRWISAKLIFSFQPAQIPQAQISDDVFDSFLVDSTSSPCGDLVDSGCDCVSGIWPDLLFRAGPWCRPPSSLPGFYCRSVSSPISFCPPSAPSPVCSKQSSWNVCPPWPSSVQTLSFSPECQPRLCGSVPSPVPSALRPSGSHPRFLWTPCPPQPLSPAWGNTQLPSVHSHSRISQRSSADPLLRFQPFLLYFVF